MIALFVQDVGSIASSRVADLNSRFGIEAVYVLVWPDYSPPVDPIPQQNRAKFQAWRASAGVPVYAWIVCSPNQAADAVAVGQLNSELSPDGWCLNIETPLQGAPLEPLLSAVKATGKPAVASLAGTSAAFSPYDYRTLDKYGVACDWQAYFDSGEGPIPADAVRELYQPSFVLAGFGMSAEYRHRLGTVYGWGRVTQIRNEVVGLFDSYKRPGFRDGDFTVTRREFGYTVVDRVLRRDGKDVGLLMGRAVYPKIRVTLDVTRSAQARPPEAWTPIAASARIPGSAKRPVSVYLAENATDEVLAAIAKGAA